MVFSSPIFLFGFLPLVLAGYFALFAPAALGAQGRLRRASIAGANLFLLFASVLFYAWGEPRLTWVMLLSVLLDYGCGLALGRVTRPATRKAILAFSIAGNLGLLGFFKYTGFALENLDAAAAALGMSDPHWRSTLQVALPIGISFYTFQSMSYTIDVYRREVAPVRSLADFACFVTMFPQLIAGPIVRYRDVASQLGDRTTSRDAFASGCERFLAGLGKKVLIANTVALPADRIFAIPAERLPPGVAWLGLACYALQIYFDFSGYSDMAVGLGRMLGFRFPENFDHPYGARSVQEFWRKWHMSLSTWFRDYLYIPLGGSRTSPLRVYANLVLVFAVCGLWHGASWNFLVWGLFHGAFLVLERLGLARWLERRPRAVGHAYTLLVALMGWVFFRAESLRHALAYFAALAGLNAPDPAGPGLASLLTRDVAVAMAAGAALSVPVVRALEAAVADAARRRRATGLALAWAGGRTAFLALAGFLSYLGVSSGTYNPFIYFRF